VCPYFVCMCVYVIRKMRNRQGIQKSKLVEEELDMKRNEFEALALLLRRVKEMRANGEMDAQHNAVAAIVTASGTDRRGVTRLQVLFL